MTHIPANIKDLAIIPTMKDCLISQGKVRDTYRVPGRDDLLLTEATDRISIFDFVLPVTVPKKGEVLTALTYFWLTQVFQKIPNHMFPHPDQDYPHNFVHFLGEEYPDIPLVRSLVIRKLGILPYEFVYRHHIGGSVFKEYQRHGTAAGQPVQEGLKKWAKIERPIFTPSTKAETGHDQNITVDAYFAETGDQQGREPVIMASDVYSRAYRYAAINGVLILDTKFELGRDGAGKLYLADEVLTPDSSRFTISSAWEQAMANGQDPPFYDKQPVRDWGSQIETLFSNKQGEKIVGLKGLNPEDLAHLEFVDSLQVPTDVISQTTERYLRIFKMITDRSLDEYQRENLL
ncbi:MAG: phosphoribosylaminoimidazolesuccinocarboxamide synthase [Patescibacteria group bacterium]